MIHVLNSTQESAEGPNQSTVWQTECSKWFPDADVKNDVAIIDVADFLEDAVTWRVVSPEMFCQDCAEIVAAREARETSDHYAAVDAALIALGLPTIAERNAAAV